MNLPALFLAFFRAKKNFSTAGATTRKHIQLIFFALEAELPRTKFFQRSTIFKYILFKVAGRKIEFQLPKVPQEGNAVCIIGVT